MVHTSIPKPARYPQGVLRGDGRVSSARPISFSDAKGAVWVETKLPPAFLRRMRTLLGPAEFEAFRASYRQGRTHGLRVNTLKIAP
ncbi:MAG TPA: hypothetical protein VIK75_00200, partial [Calditerricola sp.]